MKNLSILKYAFYAVFAFAFLYNCGGSSSEVEYEEVVLPTEGLITIVKEVEPEQFKIEDEVTIPNTEESLIVANYLDETSDTFTLAEARLMEANGYPGRSGSVMQAASYGFFGYMMMRNMSSARRPQQGAYTSKSAYDKTSQTAGQKLNQSASRTRRVKPSSGKSGYGSGSKSTRSFGG